MYILKNYSKLTTKNPRFFFLNPKYFWPEYLPLTKTELTKKYSNRSILSGGDRFQTYNHRYTTYIGTYVVLLYYKDDLFLQLPFPGATIVLFVVFVVVMAIIMMNLFVGLAVDDIKEVQEHAELKKLASQVCRK